VRVSTVGWIDFAFLFPGVSHKPEIEPLVVHSVSICLLVPVSNTRHSVANVSDADIEVDKVSQKRAGTFVAATMSSTCNGTEEESNKLLSSGLQYGSTNDEDDADEEWDQFDEHKKSFHLLGKATKLGTSNVLTSMRATQSFIDYGDEYDKVPSLLKENVALALDPNLNSRDKGHLYMAESTFFKTSEEPHYALTVNCDIYQRILNEISEAKNVPCGLYFCCHGGDDAQTGISHADFVDIRLAWMMLAGIFGGMFMLSVIW
jgi:hypothetical protein